MGEREGLERKSEYALLPSMPMPGVVAASELGASETEGQSRAPRGK